MTELVCDENKECKDCKTSEHLILDHSSGDLVCTRCGLVAAEGAFDASADWRGFSEGTVGQGGDKVAKQRGDRSSAHDPMTEDTSLGTGIGSGFANAFGLQRAQGMIAHQKDASGANGPNDAAMEQERKILQITDNIRKVAARLHLGENIVQRCTAFLQDLAQKGHLVKGKKRPWACALIHLASREEGATQTIRELAQANADYRRSGATQPGGAMGVKKDSIGGEKVASSAAMESSISSEVRDLTKQLGLAKSVAHAEDPELMARLVGRLQLAPQCAKPAASIVQETYRQGKLLGPKMNKMAPATLMAVSIYIVAWLLDVEKKPEIRHVAAVARVSPAQVMDAYLMVRPKLRYLVPKDFVCRLRDGIEGLPAKPQV